MSKQTLKEALERYESNIGRLSKLYFYLYRDSGDFDLSDLEQSGRIAVFNISRKRPEKIDNGAYVSAAIRYAIIGEMRKMRRKERHVYLASEEKEQVQLVDVFPIEERGERLDELEELFYQIKHQFSSREAESLESLLEKCDNIYDINLSQPPSTDTKDRVRVVTRMDLNDEEMRVYAEVLLGVKKRFPRRYIIEQGKIVQEAKTRGRKFFISVLSALEITPREFAKSRNIANILKKYRLWSFYQHAYSLSTLNLIKDIDSSIKPEEFSPMYKWMGLISARKISQIIYELNEKIGDMPKKRDFIENGLGGMLQKVFHNNKKLALEFSFPGIVKNIN